MQRVTSRGTFFLALAAGLSLCVGGAEPVKKPDLARENQELKEKVASLQKEVAKLQKRVTELEKLRIVTTEPEKSPDADFEARLADLELAVGVPIDQVQKSSSEVTQ